MPNYFKIDFLKKLSTKYGSIRKLKDSQSLFEIKDGLARIYVRYSKIHKNYRSFYGLRKQDLQKLEGFQSFICFLWDNQNEPLLIPYSDYEEVFQNSSAAKDGQYKVQIFLKEDGTEMYIAKSGRFNVEGYFGWEILDNLLESAKAERIPDFTHPQIQTLVGSIGANKGFDIWIPQSDRSRLDWSITKKFDCRNFLPDEFGSIRSIIQEIDIIWLQKGSNKLQALFEVEHSTPIYSGLLRFNDILLVASYLKPKFTIISNEVRRAIFVKQLNRPTFKMSGLSEICNFLEYVNVYSWHKRTLN